MAGHFLLKKFSAAARRILLGGAFAAGMLAAETGAAQEIRQMKSLPPLTEPFSIDSLLIKNPEAINEVLVMQARDDRKKLEELARTTYSHELDSLEKTLNEYLLKRGDTLVNKGVIVIDPTYVDVALALDAPLKRIAYDIFIREKLMPETDSLNAESDAMVRDFFMNFIIPPHLSPYDTSFTPRPAVRQGIGLPALLTPMSEIAPLTRIPGLTHRQNLDFINRHEGWHVLDTQLGMKDGIPTVDYSSLNDPDSLKGRGLMIAVFTIHLQKETLADVAAMGDMIRSGQPVSLIGHLIRARETSNMGSLPMTTEAYAPSFDHTHMSVLSLRALEKQIRRMGEENFRKVDDEAARKLYYRIIRKSSLNEKAVEHWLSYRDAKKAGKAVYGLRGLFNGGVKKAIRFHDIVSKPPQTPLPNRPLTAQEKDIVAQLAGFDEIGSLQQHAFKTHGKVTPETLIRSYVEFQNSLRVKIDEKPEKAEFFYAMRLRLRTAFILNLTEIDYAAVNASFGVKPADLLVKKDLAPPKR